MVDAERVPVPGGRIEQEVDVFREEPESGSGGLARGSFARDLSRSLRGLLTLPKRPGATEFGRT